MKGLIKPLKDIFDLKSDLGLFIYGYQIINSNQYIPVQIKLQLHGGI